MSSILPNIVDVASKHNLVMNPKTIGKKEVLCKCPFCLEDSNKKNKYFLSLNGDKNVYKCWYCGLFGGVVKFISLLEGKTESEIIEKLRNENSFNYKKHPAEKLSKAQLKMIGYPNVNWVKNREYDVELYLQFREVVIQKWLSFVEEQKAWAYRQVFAGILTGDYNGAIKKVKVIEQKLEISILDDVLKLISNDKRTDEEFELEMFVASVCKKEHPSLTFFIPVL